MLLDLFEKMNHQRSHTAISESFDSPTDVYWLRRSEDLWIAALKTSDGRKFRIKFEDNWGSAGVWKADFSQKTSTLQTMKNILPNFMGGNDDAFLQYRPTDRGGAMEVYANVIKAVCDFLQGNHHDVKELIVTGFTDKQRKTYDRILSSDRAKNRLSQIGYEYVFKDGRQTIMRIDSQSV